MAAETIPDQASGEAVTDPPVVVDRRGAVLLIRLNRPERRNAIDRDTAVALDAALELLDRDPGLRCGVLLGVGPVFSAGTDLYDGRDKRTTHGGEYGLLRRERVRPLIAAVEGPAVGGGFEIVMACDLVVASTGASFSLPETRRGLVATGGGLFRAARSLPYHVAAELLLAGTTLDAARAYSFGVVNRLVDPGDAETVALELATEIRAGAPNATALTLDALRISSATNEQVGWWATNRARSAVLGSGEAAEGTAAWRERRQPAWAVEQGQS
jgi:enoyl-CoA hydratase/carnithine racemase